MKPRRSSRAILAAAAISLPLVVVTAGLSATAAPTNPWHKIGAVPDNFDQPGVVVDPDGTLHILWVQPGSSNTENVVHTSATLTGSVGTSSAVQTGWAEIEAVPDLVSSSNGLQGFWGGMRSLDPTETNTDTNMASAPASGSPWTLHSGNVAKGPGDYSSNIGAALGASGTPLLSWAGGSSGVFTHAGLDPSTPNYDVQAQLGGCCGYYPDIAYDAVAGAAWITWYSNATNHVGVYVQRIDASTAAPMGSATLLPGSSTADPQIQRTPIVASKNGVYVAYVSALTSKVVLWHVSTSGVSSGTVVASGSELGAPGVAADSTGRLWVSWHRGTATYARRSNPTDTRFGATVSIAQLPAASCTSLYELTPAAADPVLDVVSTWTCSSQNAFYLGQIYPGLTVTAAPAKFTGKKTVTFTVTDAGVAVPGAKVSAGGKSATTNAQGKTSITLGPASHKERVAVTATKLHFTAGKTSVVVVPK